MKFLFILLLLLIGTAGLFLASTNKTDVQTVSTLEEEIAILKEELSEGPTSQDTATITPASNTIAVTQTQAPEVKNESNNRGILETKLKELQQQLATLEAYDVRPYIEIINPTGFVNSDPFTLEELIGEKIILVKFTTYSCINCQRTYPYVISWNEKYKDQGLAVVAIHTPEFAFEKKIENVQKAMQKEGITFPVVLDNEYATWRAYGNRFWPRMYLIDVHGNIVYDHIGEGAYDRTEAKIQELLSELSLTTI